MSRFALLEPERRELRLFRDDMLLSCRLAVVAVVVETVVADGLRPGARPADTPGATRLVVAVGLVVTVGAVVAVVVDQCFWLLTTPGRLAKQV